MCHFFVVYVFSARSGHLLLVSTVFPDVDLSNFPATFDGLKLVLGSLELTFRSIHAFFAIPGVHQLNRFTNRYLLGNTTVTNLYEDNFLTSV